MNTLLIVREEILCLIVLCFILLHSSLYKMGKDQGNFLRICFFALGHVVFDLITVLTVNAPDTVSPLLNRFCHIVFYMFALLFAYELFCYTVSLCYSKNTLRRLRRICLLPLLLYLLAVPFLPMDYLSGNGTKYSFGIAAFVGYGVAMLFFIASLVVVIGHRRQLSGAVKFALLPMQLIAIAAELLQIAVPEMLFTGGAATIISVGFFFSLENPVAVLRQKVLTDAMTGVKSRHSYEADLPGMERRFAGGTSYCLLFCDINDLKAVNDLRGHLEGDAYIACVAEILIRCLRGAESIYRMGGDEFLAVYQGEHAEVIHRELQAVEDACETETEKRDYCVSVAIGSAFSDGYPDLRSALRAADYQMYARKAQIKRRRAFILNDAEQLNIAGLTDRIFDAFAGTDTNRFLFVTNITTNVTRWSHSAVEYFGFPGEFLYNCTKQLMERIHPEDRNTFFDDISAVLSGSQRLHDLQYRILNGSGVYVVCSSTGTVLRGKNGDPDLFAGTMALHEAEESLDRLTELRNGYEMMNYFGYLLRTKTPAALVQLSIMNLSRLNMLYGYSSGNEILRQFAAMIRKVIGEHGCIFRSDGTKFVLCLSLQTAEEVRELYRTVCLATDREIRLDALTPPLQLAAGAFLLPADFDGTVSVLRSNLIYAHDRSKYEERGRLVFYEERCAAERYGEHKNELLLRIHQDAIAERAGFFLVYQAIVSAATGQIVGAEALLRWENDSFGVVSPDDFIPWLEGDPCFFSLGNWILRQALLEVKTLLPLLPDFVVNVNVAMAQLEHEGFRQAILSLLEETGFPPSQLCLELTERCRELDANCLRDEVDFFRSHGIRVALDDLGTGFSSFGLLLSLNVDEIKLDRAFVKEIRTKRVNQILTRMVIDASRSMGCHTCLEGVEDDELCHYLSDYDANYYQGYYCNRPLRLEEFRAHTTTWNKRTAQ